MKKVIEEIIPYVVIVIVVVLIRTYVVTPVIVSGGSMETTLYDGEMLLLNKFSLLTSSIERFDVVVIRDREDGDLIIKRVIGLPTENIEYRENVLYVNGEEVEDLYGSDDTKGFDIVDVCRVSEDFDVCNFNEVPEGYYLVLGDHRSVSADSRTKGFIREEDILGKVSLRIWPLTKVGFIE